jgi:succinate dehydrogenase/fumarate reductase flavoprotein subunit
MVETDVVVVGSGAAGLVAALTAAVGGASVTVLERSPLYGGTSAVSGGGMWLPGNDIDPNWTDDLAGAKVYLKKLTAGLVGDAVLDRFLAESGAVPTFLAEHTPLTFSVDIGRPDYHAPWEGSSPTSRTVFPNLYEMSRLGEFDPQVRRPGPGGQVPISNAEERELVDSGDLDAINKLLRERLARGIALRGVALVGGVMEGCLDHGVEFVANTRARELTVEDGRVAGLRAEQGGSEVEYRARLGVVLASGGFEWNRDLWDAFMAAPWEGPASPPVNEGDALIMAARAGAKLGNLDKATWIQTRYLGEKHWDRPYMRIGLAGGFPGEILVNRAGRRFVNENLNYNDIGRPFTYFDPHVYEYVNTPRFAVGDRNARARAAAYDDVAGPEGDGWVEADTLRELAEKLGIDPSGLEQQVEEYNRHAESGDDPVFHRGEKPSELHFVAKGVRRSSGEASPAVSPVAPIVEPPFVGYRVRAGVFGTRGGPVIDEYAQIVDWQNRPIPGLYGAGNAIANPFASAYPGGGGTLGPCVTFGHVSGKSVVSQGVPA